MQSETSRQVAPLKLIVICAALCALSACAPAADQLEIEHEDGYKVSVKTNGQEQKNFDQERVHRVTVSPQEIARATKSMPAKVDLPFTVQTERDLRGRASGLRVTAVQSGGALGVAKGDILTSVGFTMTKSEKDLAKIYQELKTTKQSSLTLLRDGQYHKILYYADASSR